MKKIFALAAIALFTITSCSDDSSSSTDNPNTNTDNVLLKKMVEVSDEGTTTINYNYSGNKLTGITYSDGRYETITYTGDLITLWKIYDENDVVTEQYEYEYTNGILTTEKIYQFEWSQQPGVRDYTYNPNGTISFFSQGMDAGEHTPDRMTLFNTNFNVSYVSTYDNKNNPLKNITGITKIYFSVIGGGTNYLNNVLTDTRVIPNDPDDLLDSYVYTYNSQNYPVSAVMTNHEDNEVTNIQYFYE